LVKTHNFIRYTLHTYIPTLRHTAVTRRLHYTNAFGRPEEMSVSMEKFSWFNSFSSNYPH
jgi:hypothetical protein